MTDLIEHADSEPADSAESLTQERGGPAAPKRRGLAHAMRRPRAVIVAICVVVVAGTLGAVVATTSGSGKIKPATDSLVSTVSVASPRYTPKAAVGATDDYHCTLVNPGITKNSYVISSQFRPGSPEVHHAVLALVPPAQTAQALAANAATGGKGWTCFGAPSLPNASLAAFLSTPFLSVWAPGHGADVLPKDTGIALAKGSLVIEQVHYNLLVGDKPVTNSLVLHTVPASTSLLPMQSQYLVAPPNIPCPAGVTGPYCNYQASLNYLDQRFGTDGVLMAKGIDDICGENANNPPTGDTATCTLHVGSDGYIVRIQPHMHLLGVAFTMVLNPGTPQAKTILNVPNYNFDYQKAYNVAPIPVSKGDRIQINCTYNPTLAQQLPILRKAPPHFVTFGDGSSDEMCVGVTWQTSSLPNSHDSL
jgi:Copper type II ascorbate-dependent monooxygenase, C-terminal domain